MYIKLNTGSVKAEGEFVSFEPKDVKDFSADDITSLIENLSSDDLDILVDWFKDEILHSQEGWI